MLDEKKGTCCHKCGHVHVKGTSCPTPFLKGEKSCARRTNEGLEDTSWTNDKDQTVTLQQLLDVIKNYPIIQVPIERIEKIVIKKDSGGIESDRLSAADIKHPIIIVVGDTGNFKYILDGNHRANKAIDAGLKTIPAKLVKTKELPQEFQDVLGEYIEEESKGLWANINAKRARGEKGARKGSEAYKAAVAAGNKLNELDETDSYCPTCLKEYLIEHRDIIEEAEYRGRKVQLGKPFYTPGGPKKRSVYVKNAKGNVVKVNFGDPNMKIKKSIPARRKSYRARHHCQSPGPKWKANYWSCKAW
jgi:hypothetical protein